jgi:uncharacterized membrane protein YdbT with pleckstrin-like domain
MPDVFVAEEKKEPKEKNPSKTLSVLEILRSGKKPLIPSGLDGHSQSPFASFNFFPEIVKFTAKDPKERMVLFIRKHPITNLGWILISVILLFIPSLLGFFPILDFLPERFKLIIVAMWYLGIVAYAFEQFLDWFFNCGIVTDETVYDVDFTNLIYREISETDIDHIQDVTVRMGGVVRTMFNYGDVFIQTAGEVPRIEFEAVPNPDRVAKILRELGFREEQEEKKQTSL